MYADVITQSIKRAMEITKYRRIFQTRYNKIHNITPTTIVKNVSQKEGTVHGIKHLAKSDVRRQMIELEAQMKKAAENLEFEKAIELRDAIAELAMALSRKEENEQYNQKIEGFKATKLKSPNSGRGRNY